MADRILTVQAGPSGGAGLTWRAPLYIEVETEQTTSAPPNKATVRLWNLSEPSIAMLASNKAEVIVCAGEGTAPLLFRGELLAKDVVTKRAGGDWITTVTPRDGGRKWLEGFQSVAYPPEMTWGQILSDAAASMGVPIGYIGPGFPATATCPAAWAWIGPARNAISAIVAACSCYWCLDGGKINVLGENDYLLPGMAPLIASETGLIGSPEKDAKSGIKLKVDLLSIRPGQGFVLKSRQYNGPYRATKVAHKASSDGKLWETEITGVAA